MSVETVGGLVLAFITVVLLGGMGYNFLAVGKLLDLINSINEKLGRDIAENKLTAQRELDNYKLESERNFASQMDCVAIESRWGQVLSAVQKDIGQIRDHIINRSNYTKREDQ